MLTGSQRGKAGWAAMAVAGICTLAACTGGNNSNSDNSTRTIALPGAIGSVPRQANGPQYAGTISLALQPGSTPNWIFPIDTSGSYALSNVESFQLEMWRPLYWTENGATPEVVPAMSLARPPVWSDGDKTVAITMNPTYKWSDGKPVTSKDLLFDIDLIKAAVKESPSNWPSYVPGRFPDDVVSAKTPDLSTLILRLSSPVNPDWFQEDVLSYAGPVNPLPSHAWAKVSPDGSLLDFTNPVNATRIYNFLVGQNKSVSTYATNQLWQVVDGPYHLTKYDPVSGAFTMAPNASYNGPHVAHMSTFKGIPFTSYAAELDALKTGNLDVGYVDYTAVPEIPTLKRLSYNVFGMPDFGANLMAFNFQDGTDHFGAIATQLYFRQAMAHLQDQQGEIAAFMHGAGDPSYGPIPADSRSPFLPSDETTNPYAFSVPEAISILKAHGWTVNPGGTDVCSRAGIRPDECGKDIPAGTRLAFNLVYLSTSTLIGEECTTLASNARQSGIDITLQSTSPSILFNDYSDPSAPANDSKWAMQDWGIETDNPYPTQYGFLNTGGSFQVGNYSNPTADSLITASVSSDSPAAVRNEASFLTLNEPVLWGPNPDVIWAWKTTISGEPESFESLTQYYATPEFWYFTSGH